MRSGILPRRLDGRDGASVVAALCCQKPNGGSDAKIYQQARRWSHCGTNDYCQAATNNQNAVIERSKGQGRTEIKTSSRGRDVTFADWHDHSSSDEGYRLAAALCARLLRRGVAKETTTQTQFKEG